VSDKTVPGAISRPLHVGSPNILDRSIFLKRVERILDQKMFSNDGPLVRELETSVAERLDIPHVIAVSNATIGLELVLETFPKKGEIILPSFTFVATAHAVKRMGFTPVFSDVTSDFGLLDPEQVKRLITPKTVALLPVNVYGNICDIDALTRISCEHSLKLIFDSAHVLGVRHKGIYAGTFGQAEVFSLHATKFINGFEGGLIATTDEDLAAALRRARNFGFVGYDQVNSIGTNAKLSEIHAAMALTNFEHFEEIIRHNKRIHDAYKRRLPSWMQLIGFPVHTESNFQYVVARCSGLKRDPLVKYLHGHRVLVRRYFYPGVHRMAPYSDDHHHLPVTEELSESVICLPTGQDINEDTVSYICDLIAEFDG